MKLEHVKELQNIFESNLNEILKGRFKSKQQKSALENIKSLYKSQQAVILFNEYSSFASEAKHKVKYDEGLKKLTSKQMQCTTAIAQVKAGNTSENLLNQVRQIIYSFF